MQRDQQNRPKPATLLHGSGSAQFPAGSAMSVEEATNEGLQALNHQISSILERISDGFVALDNSWRFTYLNRKGEEMFRRLQKSKGSLLGKVLWEEFPEIVGTEIEQNYRRAAQDQVTVEFETTIQPLDAWFIIRAYPSPDGLSIYFLDISRRKRTEAERTRTEEALRASEQHFRAAFNQAAVGMAVANLNGYFEEVNDRFLEILGYSREEMLQRSYAELTHPDDLDETKENVRRLLTGEIKDFVYEKRFLRKDGAVVWGLTSVTLLVDHAGKPDRFIGVIDDITHRKLAEERLRENSERLQLALAAGELGDWSWNAETDLINFGVSTAAILGLENDSPLTWEELRSRLHPDDREGARVGVEEALAKRSDYNIEYRIRHGSNYRWVAARGRGVYAKDGSVVGMNGVVQDISERKAHEAVRSRLAAVVESSDDAIISLGLDTLITTWNKGAEKTFGYTAEEVIGTSIHKLLPPDRKDEESIILGRIIAGERIEHYETVRIRKDGQHLDVSLSVSPVFDANGQLIGVSKISRDISERKKAEAALRAAQEKLRSYADDLETQVAERTAKLRDTIGELEAFSYSVSHDMRSPLRAMQGYSDALLEDYGSKLDETAQEYLNRIKRAASRMDLLIQDVLAYSRVAQGEIPLKAVDPNRVIRDVIQTYPTLQSDKAKIEISGTLPQVIGHEAYLTQAVSNILTNGVKFVAAGIFPTIEISASSEEGMVRLNFKDNGIGIAPEHRDRIFQIFGRVYSDKQYEGTGIGLAIAKKAVERMEGDIGVTSELGQGSCFYLLLRPA